MAFTPSGMYAAEQQGLFGTQPGGPTLQDYVYSQSSPGYGVQSQYLTPNYSAGYRPAYGGPTGEPNPYQSPHTQTNSAWYASQILPGPGLGYGSQVGYGQEAAGVTAYHAHNLVTIGPDAAANVLQQYITPVAAAYLGAKIANQTPFFARGAKRGLQTAFGMGVRESIGARAGGIVGRAAGGFAGGIAGGTSRALFGLGSVGGGAAMAGAAGGFAGALIGSVVAPLALGQGLYMVADKAVFDPYVQTRRGAEAMMSNTYGRAIGGRQGSVSGGLGMSAGTAYGISSSVNKASFDDYGFKDSDYTSMMDYSAQAGLFDMYSGSDFNAKNITKKVKDIAGSVKQVMQVFGEKDLQEAIGILAKFTKMGFGPGTSEFSSGLSSIRAASAYTGKSSNAIMESIFTPAAYAYQSQGLNGVIGGRAAADAYRGYEAAVKNGLVDKNVIASLGGTEGATQLQTSAMLGLAGTQYNKMAAYNQYFSGNKVDGIAGNITAFGTGMGTDPLRAKGNMALYGNQIISKQLGENRFAPISQATDLLRMIKPGDKNIADLAGVLTGSLGLSDEQAQATLLDMQSTIQTYGGTGLRTVANTNVRNRLEAENLSWTNPHLMGVMKSGWSGLKNAIGAPGSTLLGNISDVGSNFLDYAQFGLNSKAATGKDIGLAIQMQGDKSVSRFKSSSKSSESATVTAYINKYAQSMDPRIRKAANQVIKNGRFDISAFANLQSATGDTSVPINSAFAVSDEGGVYTNNVLNLGEADINASVTRMEKELGLSSKEAAFASGYDKAKKDPFQEGIFVRQNEETIRQYAIDNVEKNEIARSGAFSLPGVTELKNIPILGTFLQGVTAGDGYIGQAFLQDYSMSKEERIKRIKELKVDSKEFASLTRGVEQRLNKTLAQNSSGQVVDTFYNKGSSAARALAASGPGDLSNTSNNASNRELLNAIGDAAQVGANIGELNRQIAGIDMRTGLVLDGGRGGSGVERGGAAIAKAATLMVKAAQMQYEAADGNKKNALYKEISNATAAATPLSTNTSSDPSVWDTINAAMASVVKK